MTDLTTDTVIARINVGDEVWCDRAKLTDTAVLIQRDGVWIELRPPHSEVRKLDEVNAENARLRLKVSELEAAGELLKKLHESQIESLRRQFGLGFSVNV